MNKKIQETVQIAEKVRNACLDAFVRSYEHAGMSGLCDEGRIECALDAVRSLDLEEILSDLESKG